MSTQAQSLSARLNTLSEGNKATLQLVSRLAKLQFQPGSVPLQGDEGDVRAELTGEIHESLKQQEEELELLEQEVRDATEIKEKGNRRRESEKDRERTGLVVKVARVSEDLRQYVLTYP